MLRTLFEGVSEFDKFRLGKSAAKHFQSHRHVVRSEPSRHCNRWETGLRTQSAVIPALPLTDARRLLAQRRIDQCIDLKFVHSGKHGETQDFPPT